MSSKRLEKMIESCREEITRMEIDVTSKKAFLQGLQEAFKIYPKDGMSDTPTETILRHGSDMAKARNFLNNHGKAAHVSEIVTGIGKENTKENRVSIAGSLASYARRNDIFKKTAPNTFTLVNFNNEPADNVTSNFEPPVDFGVDTTTSFDDDDIPF